MNSPWVAVLILMNSTERLVFESIHENEYSFDSSDFYGAAQEGSPKMAKLCSPQLGIGGGAHAGTILCKRPWDAGA